MHYQSITPGQNKRSMYTDVQRVHLAQSDSRLSKNVHLMSKPCPIIWHLCMGNEEFVCLKLHLLKIPMESVYHNSEHYGWIMTRWRALRSGVAETTRLSRNILYYLKGVSAQWYQLLFNSVTTQCHRDF